MTTMITEVYDAFKEAGVSDEKAKAAAGAIAEYERHITRTESALTDINAEIKVIKSKIEVVDKEISLLKWMLGFIIAGIIAMIIKLFF